jgi:hypothetical protein
VHFKDVDPFTNGPDKKPEEFVRVSFVKGGKNKLQVIEEKRRRAVI